MIDNIAARWGGRHMMRDGALFESLGELQYRDAQSYLIFFSKLAVYLAAMKNSLPASVQHDTA